MKQALHIFRKDLRHQWTIVALYGFILVLFAVVAPQARQGILVNNPSLPLLASLLNVLIPLSWFAITVRVIHEEALVGDRQFWTTRPYRWQSLLTAKLLFVALCLWLPYLVMQCTMAMVAGLNPLNTGLLISTLMTLLYVWVPSLLIATITSTLPPAFFIAMGVAVVWGSTLSFLVARDEPRTDAPWSFPMLATVFAAFFVAVLIHQYRKRDIRTARVALAGCVVLFLSLYLGYVAMPFHSISNAVMHLHYPANAETQLHLVYEPSATSFPTENSESSSESRVSMTIPRSSAGSQSNRTSHRSQCVLHAGCKRRSLRVAMAAGRAQRLRRQHLHTAHRAARRQRHRQARKHSP